MNEVENDADDLTEAVAALYAGPLDAFVARRDTLVKELRAAGRRDDAAIVKNLRKPSRIAWALDLGALGSPHAMQALDTALSETLAAHSGKGDVRDAMNALRNAVRELAAHAARASEREGLPADASALATALHAVIGSQESLNLLRRGCLVDVPQSDGLDFLATLSPAPAFASQAKTSVSEELAREEAARAEAAIAEARSRSEEAQAALHDAKARLLSAENKLRAAEAEAQAIRDEVERAREHAQTAAGALRSAQEAATH